MEAELTPGGVERAGEEQRRQDDEENEGWIDGNVGDGGDKAEAEASQDEDDGVGRFDPVGERGEQGDEDHEDQQGEFGAVNSGAQGCSLLWCFVAPVSLWKPYRISLCRDVNGCKAED
jgi:hypothetical protein